MIEVEWFLSELYFESRGNTRRSYILDFKRLILAWFKYSCYIMPAMNDDKSQDIASTRKLLMITHISSSALTSKHLAASSCDFSDVPRRINLWRRSPNGDTNTISAASTPVVLVAGGGLLVGKDSAEPWEK